MEKILVNIVYFQHDLRIHDHPGLTAASKLNQPIIGLYANWEEDTISQFGFSKQSSLRKNVKHEALAVLKKSLAALNIPLFVFSSLDAPSLKILVDTIHVHTWLTSLEPGSEEKNKENKLIQLFQPTVTKRFASKPLLHPNDYPFLVNALPKRFTDARLLIEKSIQVRPLLPLISVQPVSPLSHLKDDFSTLHGTSSWFAHGEEHALQHLHHYFFESKKILTYKFTRNNMLAFDDSSKLSPYLALGCLSPRMIYWKLKEVESSIEKNQSTYWLWFELLWRDYFFYLHIQHGNRFFFLSGIQEKQSLWKDNERYKQAILQAKTGYPMVDANLLELYQTGWMSNRGRQNVASFITHSLHLDWRWGAALYEHYLLDYDVSSNYGNWQYLAGVGSDPREQRVFNVSLQLKKYDAKGDYVKHWLPALQNVQVPYIYQPWTMNELEQTLSQCVIGKDYPSPILDDARIQMR